jgi:PhzF family phenazine biosynthesis protein
MNDIIANDEKMQLKPTLSIATKTEKLKVDNRYKDENCVYISAPSPVFSLKTINMGEIALALNCPIDDIDKILPVQIVNGGLETLVVPMAGLEEILSVAPDLQRLNAFCMQIGVDIIILYSSETAAQGSSYRTRVFAPTFGYLEDPATGSGNSAFGYYLMSHSMWDGKMMRIEQNAFRDTPNFIQLFSKQDDPTDSRVWFGGGAVLKIEGQYYLS